MFSIYLLYQCVAQFLGPIPTPLPGKQRRRTSASFGGPQPHVHSGCVAAGSSALRAPRPSWISCQRKLGWRRGYAQRGAQRWQPGLRLCLQTSAARVVGNFALEPASVSRFLNCFQTRGVTGAGGRWRDRRASGSSGPLSPPWLIYSFSKYWTSHSASVSSPEEIRYNYPPRSGGERSMRCL